MYISFLVLSFFFYLCVAASFRNLNMNRLMLERKSLSSCVTFQEVVGTTFEESAVILKRKKSLETQSQFVIFWQSICTQKTTNDTESKE